MSNVIPVQYYLDLIDNLHIALDCGDTDKIDNAYCQLCAYVAPKLNRTHSRVYADAMQRYEAHNATQRHRTQAMPTS